MTVATSRCVIGASPISPTNLSEAEAQSRPQWHPGVRLVRTTATRVHVAADPGLACVLDGVTDEVFAWLSGFDGERCAAHLLETADIVEIGRATSIQLIQDLLRSGLLIDTSAAQTQPKLVVVGQPVLAAQLDRLHPILSLGAVPRPLVGTDWSGLAAESERLVAAAAVVADGAVVLALRGICADGAEVAFSDRLVAAGIAHLVIGAGIQSMRVGPMIVPGKSACLRCEFLASEQSDPDWPTVATHLALAEEPATDSVFTALAAADALRLLRFNVERLVGAVLVTGLGGDAVWHRPLVRQNLCGCWRA